MDFNSFMNENKHFFYTYILKVFSNYSNVQQYDVDFLETLHSIVKEKLPSKKTSPKKRKTPKKSLPKKRKESSSPVVERLETPKETSSKKRKTPKKSLPKKRKESSSPVVPQLEETPKKSLPKKRKESSSPVVQPEIQRETGRFQKKLQDIPNNNYEMEYLSDNAFDPYDSD